MEKANFANPTQNFPETLATTTVDFAEEKRKLEMAFFDRLQRRVTEADSLLCVGLDPHPKHVICSFLLLLFARI
jgi:hypothetical protein